jgi:hypothetical protein
MIRKLWTFLFGQKHTQFSHLFTSRTPYSLLISDTSDNQRDQRKKKNLEKLEKFKKWTQGFNGNPFKQIGTVLYWFQWMINESDIKYHEEKVNFLLWHWHSIWHVPFRRQGAFGML